ncbi:2-hydroxyacid dehydrogenase [Pedomonas mirosovicensis]|uniref:2-hydroxyacid dehydrogenase n=1 Tax=Pedomonas mirosovicensis TaxID=2908641 RepID=UPI00216941C5|nr:D-glycerate dehydrogenase [Pedomonas mirosovicensis]MCH8683988.1 D-glycerate dehydrogenase [Pedomonas mirosovicensis]
MTKKRPKVIVTRRLPEAVETRMAELFDVTLNLDDRPFDRAALAEAMAEADVLVPTLTDEVDADLIAGSGPNLKLIANFGNGIDHVDLGAARAKGIIVTNTPGVLTDDTADMAMALILAVPRRLAEGQKLLRSGEWKGWSPTMLLGHRIHGKRIGIVGMGRIGQAIAQRARAFGMAVHYHNRRRLPEAVERTVEATYWPRLEAMLSRVDIISINCPHTPETHHLFNAERIALMQRHAFLINTARGEIVDEPALVDALERGCIAGAGLDVFEHEPAIHPKLLELPNVVLLPHMSSATIEGRLAMGEKVIRNIKVWSDGHRPPDQVLEGWA